MEIRFDERGLVPAIILHAATGEVLTLAYMNAEALKKTEETGETWLWSRSRNELWHKGATSGHTQKVLSISADCDQDAVILRVLPKDDGPACHTGARSCFKSPNGGAMVELDATLAQRATELPDGSYTTKLLKDENLRLKKLGEETVELVHALLKSPDERAADEAADLVYHIAVALRARGVSLAKLEGVLLTRHLK
jgi:phosphoribosyl-ATP pyrophosphohydrolase/phosphoribosyl-AMP cyclohydrolase